MCRFLIFTFLTLAVGHMGAQSDFTFSKELTEQFKMGAGTYGSACGIASQDPELRIEVEKMIEDQDLNRLEVWLVSGSNVHKAYGAEGLIRLSNEGVNIGTKAVRIINLLKKSEELLSACRGCIYETITIADALSPYELD